VSRLSARLGRGLLWVLPRDFREEFGDEIAECFREGARDARNRGGLAGMVRFWMKGALDVLEAAAAERREERAMRRRAGGGGMASTDVGLDVRYAARSLRRTPGFTVVSLLTLALGIGATTAMFSVMNTALVRSLPYPEPGELVMGRATFSGNVNPWVAFPDYMDYRDEAASIESLATIGGGAGLVTVTGADEPEQARMTVVTGNIFETLGVMPVLGGTFTIDELPPDGTGEVVVSHAFWQSWFGGDRDVIGRNLVIEGGSATVVGVMPEGFRFLYDADLWIPPWPGNSDPVTRRYHNWLLVGRLADGVTLQEARTEVDVISAQLQEAYPDSNRNKALQLDALHAAMVEGYRQSLYLLVGSIVLVLLIACGNVASLLTARGSGRSAELAVRSALGAGKGRLVRHLLVECVVLAMMAGGMGVLMAVVLQDAILGFVSLDRLGITDVGMNLPMLGIALVLSLGTVLLFGIVPSLAAARTNPAEDLKEGARTAGQARGSTFRSGLVVLQVALSVVLLVASALLLKSFATLRSVDPGFRVEGLLTATISLPVERYDGPQRTQFFETLRESVQALPGVESVAMINQLPILHPAGNLAIWAPERPPETNMQTPWADRRVVLPGYFETMEIPLVEGRFIEDSDVAGSTPVIVLTRRTAEVVFPDEPVIGRQVGVDMGSAQPGYFEVVGVVEDHQLSSLSAGTRPAMFFAHEQRPFNTMRLAVAAAVDPYSLVRPVQERLWEQDREIVLSDARTMADALAGSIADRRSVTTVLGLFAAVAVALAVLGLYGVLAFYVTRRVHEIGIRVALGASGGRVLRMVVTRGMILVGVGCVLGIGGALGSARFVEQMLFQTEATDPTTFVGVTGLFLVVALGACLVPAWRALRVDPAEAFRAE
jgi:putative ABC transport system permease protein